MKLLIVDNNDSFTWNLVQLAREAGAVSVAVIKSEEVNLSEVASFDRIIFSPGPGLPAEFPVMYDILRKFPEKRILGVCLGLQAIGAYFGASLSNMVEVKHGRSTGLNLIEDDYIFSGLPKRFGVGLYHSWVVTDNSFPDDLVITAVSDDNRIMAIRHRILDIHGVQFHPESVMTPLGGQIMANWMEKEGR
jgi:anthranilate synthase component II